MDKNLKYTFWNKSSEELTGIKEKDALGKSLYDLFPEEVVGRLVTELNIFGDTRDKQ